MNEEENVNIESQAEPSESPKEQPKKKKSRRAYLEDIHRTADGRFIYTGPCFEYDEETNTRGSVLLRLWLLILPAVAACVASGLFTTPFMRDTWYTIAPFAIEFVAVGAALWAISRVTGNGRVLREYVRRQTFGSLPLRCLIAVGAAAAGIVGASVFMIIHGTSAVNAEGEVIDQTFRCFAYLALKAVVGVCCAFIARFAPSVAWKETPEKV